MTILTVWISLATVNILKIWIIPRVFLGEELHVLVLAARVRPIVLPLLIHILHLHLLVLWGRNFNCSLAQVMPAVLLILWALVELAWTISIGSRGYWEVRAVACCAVRIWVDDSPALVHFTAYLNGVLVRWVLGLLAVVSSIVELVVAARLRGIESWRDRLLDDEPSLILVPIVPQSCWIHAPGSTWVDSLLFDHLVKDTVLVSLNDSPVVCSNEWIILVMASDIWIVLGSYQLSLHGIRYWLVSVISDLSGVLDAIRGDAPDASRIYASHPSVRVVVNTGW